MGQLGAAFALLTSQYHKFAPPPRDPTPELTPGSSPEFLTLNIHRRMTHSLNMHKRLTHSLNIHMRLTHTPDPYQSTNAVSKNSERLTQSLNIHKRLTHTPDPYASPIRLTHTPDPYQSTNAVSPI
ncbi:hypothetical protein DPMN_170999 [Dreissena polymorpha]|uniref:Uncharacterized protein n=1 Tax=Dreissena polymorpha TaxID=45954 RepID=A0A9D4E0G5_DREPO|nr:hypothetical protein DPMN_170999 [Dreissena polymorpha]